MNQAITLRDLEKSCGRVRALDGLDFEVTTGEVHGFLGPGRLPRLQVVGTSERYDGPRLHTRSTHSGAGVVREMFEAEL